MCDASRTRKTAAAWDARAAGMAARALHSRYTGEFVARTLDAGADLVEVCLRYQRAKLGGGVHGVATLQCRGGGNESVAESIVNGALHQQA